MKFLLPVLRIVTLGAAIVGGAASGRAANFDTLLSHSPFGGAIGSQAEKPAGQPLEFRGTWVEGAGEYFSVHEIKTHYSAWAAINEVGHPYVVRSYDPARGTLTVDYQGETLILTLKEATILALSAAQTKPSSLPLTVTERSTPGGYRIGHVAEEIRRQQATAAASSRR